MKNELEPPTQNQSAVTTRDVQPIRVSAVPCMLQIVAYVAGAELAMAATVGWLDGVDAATAKWSLALLAVGFVLWIIPRARGDAKLATAPVEKERQALPARRDRHGFSIGGCWALSLVVACTSLVMSLLAADRIGGWPPCFDNEYSYLLQAETFLRGRLWFPSHGAMPDLFDQMHVLNEGKFASRYFPGTAMWMAPFVAIDHPYFGHWLAGMLIAVLVFATGRVLAGNLCGFVAGMVTALSPAMAIFSNLLWSSHPTMLGLSVFVFAFFRMRYCPRSVLTLTRSASEGVKAFPRLRFGLVWGMPSLAAGGISAQSWHWALLAGTGLAFAMLCRPLTAVGVAMPFAVAYAARWFRIGVGNREWVWMTAAGMLPVAAALMALFFYNHAITGSAWKTPWQQYNEIYTPRHAYGFDNGVRGDAVQGPKVVKGYDDWAANLTVSRAVDNTGVRLVQCWRWTLGVIPLAMAGVVVLFCPGAWRGGWLFLGGIVGLHAAYFPYWFEGTLGFHYVFETIPLWALVFGLATAQLYRTWCSERRSLLCPWWASLALIGLAATYLPMHGKKSAIDSEIGQLMARRVGHAKFLRLVDEQVAHRPALVLVEQGLVYSFAVNSPGLDRPVIFGRYRPQAHSLEEIAHAFPERTIYQFDASTWQIERVAVSPPGSTP